MSRRRPPVRRCQALFRLASLTLGLLLLAGSTTARAQFVITPTFGATINSDPNSAAIKATINAAIADYAANFSDPINVAIEFNGMTSGLGQSNTGFYNVAYSTFLTALKADAKTADDATANGTLPNSSTNPTNGATTINVTSANMRAIGLSGAGVVTGTTGGTFDGVIGINLGITTPGIASGSLYSLRAVVQHEIDEVLGTISGLPSSPFSTIFPSDLFRYSGAGVRSYTSASSNNVYFSIDGGTTSLANYNNAPNGGDYGDWGSSGSPRVQDAFGTPGSNPVLGVELRLLDVIGYDRRSLSAVPEPGPLALAGVVGLAGLAAHLRRRRTQTA
ncbi:MAG: NF038122 family metalloprotease [Isosphaeraceae bacterium]